MDGHVDVARLLLDHGAQVDIVILYCICVREVEMCVAERGGREKN